MMFLWISFFQVSLKSVRDSPARDDYHNNIDQEKAIPEYKTVSMLLRTIGR